MNTITIEFKYQSKNNQNVHIDGYVEFPNTPECEDNEIETYYYDQQGFTRQQVFIHHDQVEITPTYEQDNEIDELKNAFMEDDLFLEIICHYNENENITLERPKAYLIINEGAQMECEIEQPTDYRGDYIVEVIPKFNNKKINLIPYMKEMGETFDPWGNQEPSSCIENGHIYFEMSKDYWEGDKQDYNARLKEVNEEARRIYARALTYEMGIYAKYGENIEQSMDDYYDNEWLFKMSQHTNDSDEELNTFLLDEGFIEEEII